MFDVSRLYNCGQITLPWAIPESSRVHVRNYPRQRFSPLISGLSECTYVCVYVSHPNTWPPSNTQMTHSNWPRKRTRPPHSGRSRLHTLTQTRVETNGPEPWSRWGGKGMILEPRRRQRNEERVRKDVSGPLKRWINSPDHEHGWWPPGLTTKLDRSRRVETGEGLRLASWVC